MDFVGFLRFSLLCLDFLAWPAFALLYPIWASIRAIETSSKHHMKKLVTYWTIFSLISLFEIFFVKVIEWVPFWPYIKLVVICWLVIPRFNGACHVYQQLIHPCLSVNPRDIISRCSIRKDKPYGEDSFLALAETYLKENGPEALEKIIASKAKHNKHILNDAAPEVVKRMEPTEENVTAEEQLVEHPKLHLVESEKNEVAAPEAQMVTIPTESKEKGLSEIHGLRKVQSAWTCAVCQLTTGSEATLNSHLLGREHKSKCEKLKISAQTTKSMHLSASKGKPNTEELKTNRQTSNDLNFSAMQTNYSNQTKNDPKVCLPGERSKLKTTENPKSMHIGAASEHQMQGNHDSDLEEAEQKKRRRRRKKKVILSLRQVQREWACAVCQLTTRSEATLNSHLLGMEHKSNCEKLKISARTTKNTQSSAAKGKSNTGELKTNGQTSNDLNSSAKQTNYSNQTKNDPKVCLPGERSKQKTTEKPKSMHIGAASEQ